MSDVEEEELVGEHMYADYQPDAELDAYESEGIHDDAASDISPEARFAAEAEIDARRAQMAGARPAFPIAPSSDIHSSSSPVRAPAASSDTLLSGVEHDDAMDSLDFDFTEVKGPITEWVVKEEVRRGIVQQFRLFLEMGEDENRRKLVDKKIVAMVNKGSASLEISFTELTKAFGSILAIWLSDAPTQMLEIFDSVATERTFKLFPHFRKLIASDIVRVRITDLPISDAIRDIRQSHINLLIKLGGVVTRRSMVYPKLSAIKFDCNKCGFVMGPVTQTGDKEVKLNQFACIQCHSRGDFRINYTETVYRNFQTLTLQESPGQVPAGRLPRSIEVVLLDDLVDVTKPGEQVEVTGIYKNGFDPVLNHQHGFPVFSTHLEANYVERKTANQASNRLLDSDKELIRQLAKDPTIKSKIIRSMAPSTHGHEDIKLGLALALFGGQEKEAGEPGQHRIRGDINVLMLGDPGTAKSQFLKFIERTSHRAVYTTGRGSTAVGLTAAVHKTGNSNDWSLEGGALVIADRGVCLIDEFDKMSDKDRTSIHEAMEQQTISLSKAGIITTLQARCAVIAAANPVGGRYDEGQTFEANVDMTQPILQRFDLLFVVRDEVDALKDEHLARFVCTSHIKNHPTTLALRRAQLEEAAEAENPLTADIIPQDLLRKYIMYARENVHPTVAHIDENKIANLYKELRKESLMGGGVTMSVRHIESIIRLSEAHARLHLRDYVRLDDENAAIALFLRCFISTQKYEAKKYMLEKFHKYLVSQGDHEQLLLHLLREKVKGLMDYQNRVQGFYEPKDIVIPVSELLQKAADYEIFDLEPFFASRAFLHDFRLDPATQTISKRMLS